MSSSYFTNRSIILSTDSYKCSHWLQYPAGTTKTFSYIESRGGAYAETLFFGLQAYIKQYLLKPITQADIDFAQSFLEQHLPNNVPFNKIGWDRILKVHNGFLPVRIKAVSEGRIVPVHNAIVTVENTDPNCAWVTSYLETSLLRGIWAGTTAATRSYNIKKIIDHYLKKTSDITDPMGKLNWSLHDFGARGGKSGEAVAIADAGHLISFMGTDTIEGILFAMEYYGADVCANSIAASEHSVATAFGADDEVGYIRQMIRTFGKPNAVFAAVADSYDVFNYCQNVLPKVKDELIASGATYVCRPDSGNPVEVSLKVLQLLDSVFASKVNSKGYKVLNNVRIIYGDGINSETIELVLKNLESHGYSTENIAFGCGSYLLDQFNRDTQRWAMKLSAMEINGIYKPVCKSPKTDPEKASKAGYLELVSKNGQFETIQRSELADRVQNGWQAELETVYENGNLLREQTFSEIRNRSGCIAAV